MITSKTRFLVYLFAIQALVCMSILLDIPFVRQVSSFIYLIFIPGFVLLRLFKIEKLDNIETFLFSIGLSVAFLMLVGFLANELGSLLLISEPLSIVPLFTIISLSVFFLTVLNCFIGKREFSINFSKDLKIFNLLPYFALPFLSIIGVMLFIAFEINYLLIIIILIIPVLFIWTFFFKTASYYPITLFSIAASLLFASALISNQIHGYDIHLDFFVFNVTKSMSFWSPSIIWNMLNMTYLGPAYVYSSMLSITILPTIFSNITLIEEIWIFKSLYPLIFSLVPLAAYQLLKEHWGAKISFLSIIFFMSNVVFFDFRNTSKEMIAELFYVLLFLVIFKKDINQRAKMLLFMFFSFALIVSYYTMTYIFLIFVILTWFLAGRFKQKTNLKITFSIINIFSVFTFLWYIYISSAPFSRLENFLNGAFKDVIVDFFTPASRGGAVLSAIGILEAPTFLHQIGRYLFDATAIFILIGFFALIIKRKKYDTELFSLTSLNIILLLFTIILPNFSTAFQLDRIYHVVLLFLSPLFILGGRIFFDSILKPFRLKIKKIKDGLSLILILIVMIAFFLFQTGFVYEITADPVPSSVSLSKNRFDEFSLMQLGYVNENDFFGAKWLSKYAGANNVTIFSDTKAKFQILTSSTIILPRVVIISNTTTFDSESYVYLDKFNTMSGKLAYDTRRTFNIYYNITELPIFNGSIVGTDKVYSNGACEIYYYTP